MISLSFPELVAMGAAIALGYTVFGLGGFGANVVALPLLAHLMSLRLAVPLLLMLDLLSAALLSVRARPLIDRAELRRLAPAMLAGMALGLPVLQLAAERWLLSLLGIFVGGFALWSLLGRAGLRPVRAHWAWPAGLAGGVFSTLFGTGGPIYTLYLARRIADARRLRATIGAVVLGSALVRLLLFAGGGLLTQPGLPALALVALPCALAGYAVGSRLHARLPQAQVRRAVWVLLVASAASLLARAAVAA